MPMVEEKDDSHTSSSEINEEILIVSLAPHVVHIKIITDNDVTIVWAHLTMPPPSLGASTLYDFYRDPSLAEWAISDDDDDGFRWQKYFSR